MARMISGNGGGGSGGGGGGAAAGAAPGVSSSAVSAGFGRPTLPTDPGRTLVSGAVPVQRTSGLVELNVSDDPFAPWDPSGLFRTLPITPSFPPSFWFPPRGPRSKIMMKPDPGRSVGLPGKVFFGLPGDPGDPEPVGGLPFDFRFGPQPDPGSVPPPPPRFPPPGQRPDPPRPRGRFFHFGYSPYAPPPPSSYQFVAPSGITQPPPPASLNPSVSVVFGGQHGGVFGLRFGGDSDLPPDVRARMEQIDQFLAGRTMGAMVRSGRAGAAQSKGAEMASGKQTGIPPGLRVKGPGFDVPGRRAARARRPGVGLLDEIDSFLRRILET